jgi:hypothetical protein
MVVEIFVAQRHPVDSLQDQRLHCVFDPSGGVPIVVEK